jgi:uncharacterized protein YbjT (DUF2867 family)
VDIAVGDLRDAASVNAAVRGCRAVVSAAHGFVGPGGVSPEQVDREGNRLLIRAAVEGEVERFVLVSMAGAAVDHPMSLARAKFAAEEELRKSGLGFAIIRAAPFMETWLGIIGAPLETKGHALVLGPGTNPVNFVSVRDVAALALIAARSDAMGYTYELGGPENLGFRAIAERITQSRGRPGRIKHVPLAALRAMSFLARPFSPAFARQAQAAVLMNTTDMTFDPRARNALPDVPITKFADVISVG